MYCLYNALAVSSGRFSKLGAQGKDMYGAHLIQTLIENRGKKCTDWMVDRQVKLIYVEVKEMRKNVFPFKPCIHFFTPKRTWKAENTQSVVLLKL